MPDRFQWTLASIIISFLNELKTLSYLVYEIFSEKMNIEIIQNMSAQVITVKINSM